MLSYRHGFHAGSAADVLKHTVLVFCLEYLTKKEKALVCIDTHAGAGIYPINESGEWEKGMGKLYGFRGPGMICPAPVLRYADLAAADKNLYPGSPLLAAKLLRAQDRLVCFELHPKEFTLLESAIAELKQSLPNCPKTEVRREDGPASLKRLLPPKSGRGLVLIDPSWEENDEYTGIPNHISAALKRFARGTYIVWYPLLEKPKAPQRGNETFGKTLLDLHSGGRCRAELYSTVSNRGIHSPRGMYGSGLVIYNPPWTLRHAFEEIMPFLAGVLMTEGKWTLEWKE